MPMRSALFACFVVFVSMAVPCRADFGDAESPWSATVQTGGTLAIGTVEHRVSGKLVDTDDDDIDITFDLRGSVTRSFGRWLALTGQLGWTNWDSYYRI